MKKIILLAFIPAFIACNNGQREATTVTEPVQTTDSINAETQPSKIKSQPESKSEEPEAMLEKDILFNGKLKRYFRLAEFERFFGKPDSTRALDETACSYIFEDADGNTDANAQHLFKDGSTFENAKEKVAVAEFRFTNNNFVLYKGKTLNASTTLKELQQLFPNAAGKIQLLEDRIRVINLREDEQHISDGLIKIYLKDEQLYSLRWWFPC